MAVRYDTRYPGQVDAAIAGYPYGRARNVNTPGSGDGTPWERDLVNDIFGLQQALLTEAELVPSGVPDTSALSQYLEAIKQLTRRVACVVNLTTPVALNDNGYFTLAIGSQSVDAGFTTVVDGVSWLVVPEPGWYWVGLDLQIGSTNTALPTIAQAWIECSGSSIVRCRGHRWSANPSHSFGLVGHGLIQCGSEAGQDRIGVRLQQGESALVDPGILSRMSVVRVTGGKASTGW